MWGLLSFTQMMLNNGLQDWWKQVEVYYLNASNTVTNIKLCFKPLLSLIDK